MKDLLWRRWLETTTTRSHRPVLIEAEDGREWTGDELTRHSLEFHETLSCFLPGQRVAFRLPNGPDWFALFLASQRAGLGAIPLDAGLPGEGCRETARRLGACALFLDGTFQRLKVAGRQPSCSCIKVTSGSDGQPKGIACRAEHLIADGLQVAATMKIRPRDINFAAIPLGHSYGLGNLVLPLFLQGTTVVTAREYLPRQVVEWVGRYGVTVLPLVPALARVLSELPGEARLPKLRTVISAGAMLSPAVAEAFFRKYGRKIHNFYGSSETGGICYDRTGRASLAGSSVGTLLDGVKVEMAAGKITVESAAVATRSGRFTLPDIGGWNAKGELVLQGRRGREGNIGGKKVHPREVEQILRAMSGVQDAQVWVNHARGRDVLCAAVETRATAAEIEKELGTRIPAWKMPKQLLVVCELPRTARGKLDMAVLRRHLE